LTQRVVGQTVLMLGDTTPVDVFLERRHSKTNRNGNLGVISHSKTKKTFIYASQSWAIIFRKINRFVTKNCEGWYVLMPPCGTLTVKAVFFTSTNKIHNLDDSRSILSHNIQRIHN
jgi:hypothetical protein